MNEAPANQLARSCVGCGVTWVPAPGDDDTACPACRHTDRRADTHVVRPGHPCPICGAGHPDNPDDAP